MTVIYPSPIFGPVHSRRLGVSLGVNLMPADGKICTFDCIYCECGLNAERPVRLPRPTREEVRTALQHKLAEMQATGTAPDVITFAGNGEPTAHPQFPEIIADTLALRNRFFPNAKVSVLSNATRTPNEEVHRALMSVDNNIQKLDTVCPDYIQRINRPQGHYDVVEIIKALAAFKGHVIVQTMFMAGTDADGADVDNCGDEYVLPWLAAVKQIAPSEVMIYTIARETPVQSLRKAAPERLDRIARLLEAEGIKVSVSY